MQESMNELRGELENMPNLAESSRVINLPIEMIDVNPYQPRKNFLDDELQSLANSIKKDGIIQPLIVSEQGPQHYVLVAGERRMRAARVCGLKTVPAIIKETSGQDLLRLALVENIQRSELDPIEEARAYAVLINEFGLTHEQCASQVGKDRTSVSNSLRLLSLPSSIQIDLIQKKMSIGHAKAILTLNTQQKMELARDLILAKGLNVRQAEQICRNMRATGTEDSDKDRDPNLDYLAENLRTHFRTKVRMLGKGNRGKIEISYFSASELERILDLVGINVT